jgi:chaperonin GroES
MELGTRTGCPADELVEPFLMFKRVPQNFWHSSLDAANRLPKSPAESECSVEGSLSERHSWLGQQRRLNMKFRPLHDRVVVRRIDAEEKTAGGIIIPDTAKEKPQQGEVLAVGPGKRDETGKLVAPDLREGDQILFGKWSGTEVKIDGEDLLIMKEDDIMGVVEGIAAKSKGAGASTTRRVGAIAAMLALALLATVPLVGF